MSDQWLVFRGGFPPKWRTKVLRGLFALWPFAVWEPAGKGDASPLASVIDPETLPDEFFLYENEAAHESWTRDGRTDDNDDKMVHILVGYETITWVTAPGMVSDHIKITLLGMGGKQEE